MLKQAVTLLEMKPVVFDGLVYVLLAFFTFSNQFFGNDEAFKYVNVHVLYWLKYFSGAGAGVMLALKLYRSTGYAKHLLDKQDEGKQVTVVSTSTETIKKTEDKPADAVPKDSTSSQAKSVATILFMIALIPNLGGMYSLI